MYRVAVFKPNGMLDFWDYREFDTREAANDHMKNIQCKYRGIMSVVKK